MTQHALRDPEVDGSAIDEDGATAEVEALVDAGRLADAARVTEQAGRALRASSAGALELRLLHSSVLFSLGRSGEAAERAHVACASPLLSPRLLSEAAAAELLALLEQGDVDQLWNPAERILAGTTGAGDDDGAFALALTAYGHIAWDEGRARDALGALHAAVARTDHVPPGRAYPGSLYPRVCLARALTALTDFESAEWVIDDLERCVDDSGAEPWAGVPPVLRGRLYLAAGRYDEARDETQHALTMADGESARFWLCLASATFAEVALQEGDGRGARAYARRARMHASHGAGFGIASLELLHTRATAQDEYERCAAVVDKVCDGTSRGRRILVEEPEAGQWLIRVALDHGDGARAAKVVECLEHLAADSPGIDVLRSRAARGQALLAGHCRRARPDHRPLTGWRSLTSREQRVAVIAACGRTNREIAARLFLSPHTVDFHLRQVYRKLDLHSRVELARFVATNDDIE
jgi:DNA-binding CsgD family transcriptional regulator/tetratricopeptide (TPR) repeat protein